MSCQLLADRKIKENEQVYASSVGLRIIARLCHREVKSR